MRCRREHSPHSQCQTRSHLGRKLRESLPVPSGHRQGHEGRSGETRVEVDCLRLVEVDLWLNLPERAHPADEASLNRFRVRSYAPRGWKRKAGFSTRGVRTLLGGTNASLLIWALEGNGFVMQGRSVLWASWAQTFRLKVGVRVRFVYLGRDSKFTPRKGSFEVERVYFWQRVEKQQHEMERLLKEAVFFVVPGIQSFLPQKRRLEGGGINRSRDPKLHHSKKKPFREKGIGRTRYEISRCQLKRRYSFMLVCNTNNHVKQALSSSPA